MLELEQSTVMLRKHALEVERRHANAAQEFSSKAGALDARLAQAVRDRDDARGRAQACEDRHREELAAHASTRADLLRRERELGNQRDAASRLQPQHRAAEARLGDAKARLDAVHGKMLEERNRSAALSKKLEVERRACRDWASQRLDLLDQFCDEEKQFRKLTSSDHA